MLIYSDCCADRCACYMHLNDTTLCVNYVCTTHYMFLVSVAFSVLCVIMYYAYMCCLHNTENGRIE